jgi:Ca2+-binding EF-hand superfamily protein
MLIRKPIVDTNAPFAEAFEWFDYAETGILTKGELRELFRICSPYSAMHREDFKTIINQFDFNKDGQLTIDDFKRMSFV